MTIHTKVIGRRGPALAPLTISTLPGLQTVRELLVSVVREQVQAFQLRQEARRFVRILTEKQIAEGQEAGKISFGGDDLQQNVDVEKAIAAALSAFEDQFYFLFVDEMQMESLDCQVSLRPSTEMLFLRLTPLVGG